MAPIPCLEPHHKNEGASGDMYENKGEEIFAPAYPAMSMKTQALHAYKR
jgi:hypothetical protein